MTKQEDKIEVADANKAADGPAAAERPREDATAPAEAVDEVAQLRAKVAELSDKHLRAVAELHNYRRRAATEWQEAVRYASADLIKALLPAVDDLERSLAAAQDESASALAEGVKLVHQNLLKALEAHHVVRIASAGQPFDPQLHEALVQQPTAEKPPGMVLEEYRPGYKLWDRVLQHAKVIVSKAVEPAAGDGDGRRVSG